MSRFIFHCQNRQRQNVEEYHLDCPDLEEAVLQAYTLILDMADKFTTAKAMMEWRMVVSDESENPLFNVSFSSVISSLEKEDAVIIEIGKRSLTHLSFVIPRISDDAALFKPVASRH